MVFFPQDLRLDRYPHDADILYEDAILTLTRWEHVSDILFVGAFLKHAPSRDGQLYVAQNIVDLRRPVEEKYRDEVGYEVRKDPVWVHTEGNASLHAVERLFADLKGLADHYNKAILQPFIGVRKATVPPNPCWGENPTLLGVQPTSRKNMRKAVIERDIYRCCVTGRLDVDVADLDPVDLRDTVVEMGPYVPGNLESLEVAHVFPHAFNKFSPKNKAHVQRAKIIWMAFTNFSGFNLDNLLGVGINEDHNLFMLAPVVHKLYDRLELWFNPLEDEVMSHGVKIAQYYGDALRTLGKVQLKDRVDPRWLAIHRSICLITQENRGFRDQAFELKADQPDEDEDV